MDLCIEYCPVGVDAEPSSDTCFACGEPIVWSWFEIGPSDALSRFVFHDARCVGAWLNLVSAESTAEPSDITDAARLMTLVTALEQS